jgi:beta-galactosidase
MKLRPERIFKMKHTKKTLVLTAIAAGIVSSVTGSDLKLTDSEPRIETLFYSGWTFYNGDNAAVKDDVAPEGGRPVTVPHDWQIEKPADAKFEGSQGFFERSGVGWYRKEFELTEVNPEKSYQIHFDRAFDRTEVYVNGQAAGRYMYGYMSFHFDITDLLRAGKNVLAVRVDNSKGWDSRWYSGAGITGDVKLIETGKTRIAEYGINIVSSLNDDLSEAEVTVSVDLEGADGTDCILSGSLRNGAIKMNSEGKDKLVFHVRKPVLWSAEKPNLYDLELSLSVDGKTVDRRQCKVGIRKVEFRPKEGLFVNGEDTVLKGGCLHVDGGGIGAATSEWSWRRRLAGMKSLGFNAIRCSHNPYPPVFYQLCDEMGFYVIDEVWDKWNYPYVTEGNEWERIMHDWLARDRKHACIILWSVGNEVADQGSDAMISTLKKFSDYVKKYEPTRPVGLALIAWYSFVPPSDENDKRESEIRAIGRILEHTDVLMTNYQEFRYDKVLATYPDTLIIGSETVQFFRGEGNMLKAYQDLNPWFDVANNKSVIGSFQWSAVAYLGEASGWPSRGWPGALIRTDESRTPISWLLQSYWVDKPFVKFAVMDNSLRSDKVNPMWSSPKMTTHWNYEQPSVQEYAVFSNCDEIEVKVNNTVYPRRKPSDYSSKYVRSYVMYEPGTVTVAGYRNGRKVAEDVVRTADAPAKLMVSADRTEIASDFYDLCYFRVTPLDKNGVVCETADNLVKFSVEGPGEIVAVDNGDLFANYHYQDSAVPCFRGGATVVVKAKPGATGEIKVKAESNGMTSAEASVMAMKDTIPSWK